MYLNIKQHICLLFIVAVYKYIYDNFSAIKKQWSQFSSETKVVSIKELKFRFGVILKKNNNNRLN